ncbi:MULTISPECIES: hypothetical protein [unclassified Bradyrhizobium]|uniref:hypothetical protein n=1 Tax=unclassified Bradyrhizobium TaxID=2631580 RepID=UPI00291610B5|nr:MULTISPECIES: hypothetical protein [unclassified Bradyrhizobium]
MLHRVTATLQGHPWDLWGLSQLFDGSDSSKTLVVATKPIGRPTFDVNDPDQRARFRIQGYDVFGQLTCDELVLDGTTGDLRDLRPVADGIIIRLNGLARTFDPTFAPVRLTHLSYPKENGAGAMTAGDWTPNRDSTFLSASYRDLSTRALKLAGADPAVNFVLDAMTLPATWASLYLVYDAVSTNVGGKPALKKLSWLTDDQLSDLTNSANSSRNIREGARHGSRVDSNRPLIPLDVAHIYTCQLVAQWLDWLVNHGK